MSSVEVCLSPDLYACRKTQGNNHIALVVDVLRASSTIIVAIEQGVQKLIPITDMSKLSELKKNGYLIISERDGLPADFADFGNSPLQILNASVKNAAMAICTTNGTRALSVASEAEKTVIGSFANMSALCNSLKEWNKDVVIVCAGWKSRFSLEDVLFAGAVCEQLTENTHFSSDDDSVIAAIELWKNAKDNIIDYISRSEHYKRLFDLGMGESVSYCFKVDTCSVVPVLIKGSIVNYLIEN
ncbi:MAG: 2-phosphosulfolactate phosphatase [Bacteroidales bacterium]|jgi:2-phosphosulfolactate phosphatase|nr:2-phosphosulfolactate phosphatase [Bacteroidales bacterium]